MRSRTNEDDPGGRDIATASSVFAFFAAVCCNGDPFATLVSEQRGGQVRTVAGGEGATLPYIGTTNSLRHPDLTGP
jgi:hypothetical protein